MRRAFNCAFTGVRTFAFVTISILVPVAPAHAGNPLAEAFELAWQRQPAAVSLAERQRAVAARRSAADALTAAPPSLELGARSDRFNRNQGQRELEAGLAVPLWLPGERSGAQAVAAADEAALSGRVASLRLELARQVRELWWGWQAVRNEQGLADERLAAAQRLRDDVAHRFQAGDLSRADLNQAEGLAAQARAQLAEATAAEASARFRLESLTGPIGGLSGAAAGGKPAGRTGSDARLEGERAVDVTPGGEGMAGSDSAAHPRLRALLAQGELARRQADLVRVQSRSNPELAISTRYDWAAAGLENDATWALSLRIPFGGGPRHDARMATANAEALEAGAQLVLEQDRLSREVAALRSQFAAAQAQVTAAQMRAALAGENRGFFEKSFRLGESDLPTRLRIEAEAFEAARALGSARIGRERTLSQLRQALGLLPE